MLTRHVLKNFLNYNINTGIFTWKQKRGSRICVGDIAGSTSRFGYRCIKLFGTQYKAHRLAWLYVHGRFPIEQLDHIDGNRSNNILLNLREVTPLENQRNRKRNKNNKTGFTGVRWITDCSKWTAQIKISGECIVLGYYTDIISAVIARKKANIKYGFSDTHGREQVVYDI